MRLSSLHDCREPGNIPRAPDRWKPDLFLGGCVDILVVNQNPQQQRAAKLKLEAERHRVVVANSYLLARHIAAEKTFDIALIDLLTHPEAKEDADNDGIDPFLERAGDVEHPMFIFPELRCTKFVVVVIKPPNDASSPPESRGWFTCKALVVPRRKSVTIRTPLNADGTKDWSAVLARLLNFEELMVARRRY